MSRVLLSSVHVETLISEFVPVLLESGLVHNSVERTLVGNSSVSRRKTFFTLNQISKTLIRLRTEPFKGVEVIGIITYRFGSRSIRHSQVEAQSLGLDVGESGLGEQ